MMTAFFKRLAAGLLRTAALVALPATALACFGSAAWPTLAADSTGAPTHAIRSEGAAHAAASQEMLQDWDETARGSQSVPRDLQAKLNSLDAELNKLQLKKRHVRGLERAVLEQQIRVARQEFGAVRNLIVRLHSGQLTGKQAEQRFHLLLPAIRQLDKAVNGFIAMERAKHQASSFSFTLQF